MTDTLQAVYDVRDGSYVPSEPFDQWASSHGIGPDATYRIEIYRPLLWPLRRRFARVFAYDLDEDGHVQLNEDGSDSAKREPYDIPISSMPQVKPATTPSQIEEIQ